MDFSNNPHLKEYLRKKEMELEAKKASRKRIIEEQNRKKWLEYQQHLRNTLGFGYDYSSLGYVSHVETNLLLYYDPSNLSSYSGTGTIITDLSGNGLNGTMSNITHTSPYFTYNGSNSQVSIADNSVLEPESGDFTIETWFYASSTTGGTVILGKFDNGGAADDVSYSIRTSNTTLFADIGDGTGGVLGADYINSTNYTFSANTWYQVVYVWKSGVSLETYINGSSIGSVSHSLTSILNHSNPLYLGRYNGGEYAQNFNGRIGITRLYGTSLSSSEVLINYNGDKSKYGL